MHYRDSDLGQTSLDKPILWRPWMGRLAFVIACLMSLAIPVALYALLRGEARVLTMGLYGAASFAAFMHMTGYFRVKRMHVLQACWWPVTIVLLPMLWLGRWVVRGS